MKNLILLISFLLAQFLVQGQNNIHVSDPQDWYSSGGNIENLIINVEPKGLFAEVAFTFDLSTEDNYDPEAQLEWVFQFELDDPNLIFNDSWLWIEDYISKGVVYDKEEGVAIYEGIVNRRQDPSILTKNSPKDYMLKVYPLFADSTRKVKISYLAPLHINGNLSNLDIDVSIFENSENALEKATLNIKEDANWFHYELPPSIGEMTTSVGTYTSYTLSSFSELQDINLEFQRQENTSNFFFGTYADGDEHFYQLNFTSSINANRPPAYHVFAIDYVNNGQTNISIEEILSDIERYATSNLKETDFINFVYSDFGHHLYADEYFLCTDENIRTAIDDMRGDIDGLGVLVEALSTGVKFIQDQGQKAEFTVISSSTSYGSQEYTSELENGLKALLNSNPTEVLINFINIAIYGPSHWINNTRYYGNDYLYTQLNKLTDGLYFNNVDYTLNQSIDLVTSGIISAEEYDLDLEPTNGFSYGNSVRSNFKEGISLQGDITIVGKYRGTFPIQVDLRGLYNDQVFDQSFTIEEDQAVQLDQYAKKVWTGGLILQNEYEQNPSLQQVVIEASKEERLLSSLTTFLCLEGDTIQSASSVDTDGDVVISTDDLDANEIGIIAYPNPVSTFLTVEVPSDFYSDKLEISLYNALGMLIKIIDVDVEKLGEKYLLTWEPNELKSGLYIMTLMNGEQRANLKIMVQR